MLAMMIDTNSDTIDAADIVRAQLRDVAATLSQDYSVPLRWLPASDASASPLLAGSFAGAAAILPSALFDMEASMTLAENTSAAVKLPSAPFAPFDSTIVAFREWDTAVCLLCCPS